MWYKYYALIAWGGTQEGHRPRTKLLMVTHESPGYVHGHFEKGDGSTTLENKYRASKVLKTWPHKPTDKQVREFRKTLAVIEGPPR